MTQSESQINLLLKAAESIPDLDVITTLINEGANIHIRDWQGSTLVKLACKNENPEVLGALIKAGVDVNIPDLKGWSPLGVSVSRSAPNMAVVKALIAAGADVNHKGPGNAMLPIIWAAEENREATVVNLLIEAGADVNAQSNHWTPLMGAASWNQNHAIVEALLNAGADPNIQDAIGHTALMKCVVKNVDPKLIAQLIDGGTDVNIRDNEGNTALDYTHKEKKNAETVDLLIKAGARAASTPPPVPDAFAGRAVDARGLHPVLQNWHRNRQLVDPQFWLHGHHFIECEPTGEVILILVIQGQWPTGAVQMLVDGLEKHLPGRVAVTDASEGHAKVAVYCGGLEAQPSVQHVLQRGAAALYCALSTFFLLCRRRVPGTPPPLKFISEPPKERPGILRLLDHIGITGTLKEAGLDGRLNDETIVDAPRAIAANTPADQLRAHYKCFGKWRHGWGGPCTDEIIAITNCLEVDAEKIPANLAELYAITGSGKDWQLIHTPQ
jgi:ankyrin repeat protein